MEAKEFWDLIDQYIKVNNMDLNLLNTKLGFGLGYLRKKKKDNGMSEKKYEVKVEVLYASGNYATAYLGYSSLYKKYLFSPEFNNRTLSEVELDNLANNGRDYWSCAVLVEDGE